MELKSSIAIFSNEKDSELETRPITPSDVFEAAKEVVKTKQTKMVKNRMGVFVITYSETGPFLEPCLGDDWLPVQVYVLRKWSSGGIRKSELELYENDRSKIT